MTISVDGVFLTGVTMSLEAIIQENTAATKELIEVSKALMSLRAEAIESTKAAAKPGAATKKATKKPETAKEESKANISESPEDRKDPNNEDEDPNKAIVVEFIAGATTPEEREARKEKVKKLLAHKAIEAKNVASVPADKSELFIKNITGLIAKGDVLEPASDDLDI